jgi:hypothetical protein
MAPGHHGLLAHEIGAVIGPDFDGPRAGALDAGNRQRPLEVAGAVEGHGLAAGHVLDHGSALGRKIAQRSVADPRLSDGPIRQLIRPQVDQQLLGNDDAGRRLA